MADRKQFRLFISSTFSDMNKERDYLVNNTFYKLRELCNERNVDFVPIELRWGLSSTRGKAHIISACLNEIEESHPFFVGIVGDRYGWIPTIDELYETNSQYYESSEENRNQRPKIFDHYPWLESDIKSGLSITEIEMQFAALRDRNDKAFFYIKDVSRNKTLDNKRISESTYSLHEIIEGLVLQKKLTALKEKIRNTEGIRSADYTSISDLGDKVYNDLKSVIEKEFPLDNSFKAEEFWHDNSFKHKVKRSLDDYDLSEAFRRIDAIIRDDDCRFVRIQGKKGCGKSYLLVNYLSHLSKHGKRIFYYDVNEADISKPDINFIIDFERYISYVIARDFGLTIKKCKSGWLKNTLNAIIQLNKLALSSLFGKKAQQDFQSIITQWYAAIFVNPTIKDIQNRLNEISKIDEDIVIGLDNIDHLSSTELSLTDDLDFFPSNIKIVYSARPESKLWNNSNTRCFHCDNLFRDNIETYIKSYFKKYGKEDIHQEAIEKMRQSALSDTPLNLNKILDLLVSFGSFERIDSEIERLTSLKNKKCLYHEHVRTLVREFDSDSCHPVANILATLALSQRGLTEEEIRDITPIDFNDWISIRPHLKELIEIEYGFYLLDTDLKEAILESLPQDLILCRCDAMIQYFSSLFSFRTNGLGFEGVVESELNNLQRQVKELPHLYEYKKDYLTLAHYLSFPFHDECLEHKERVHFWKVLYANNYSMAKCIDIGCCHSSAKYSLKYRNVPLSRLEGHKGLIVNPSEKDVQLFLARLCNTASILFNTDDYAWLLNNRTNIDKDDASLLSSLHEHFSNKDFDALLRDYESGVLSFVEDLVLVESVVSIVYLYKKDIESMGVHLNLALTELLNHSTSDLSTFSYFMFATGLYLYANNDVKFAEDVNTLLDSFNLDIINQVTQEHCFYYFGKSLVLMRLNKDFSTALDRAVVLSDTIFGKDFEVSQITHQLQNEWLKYKKVVQHNGSSLEQ